MMNKHTVILVSLLVLALLLACDLTAGGTPTEDPRASKILNVRVMQSTLAPDSYHVVIDYQMNPDDPDFNLTCKVPDQNGKMYDYGTVLFSTSDTYTDFYIAIKQPGNYTVVCSDGKHSVQDTFTVEQGITISDGTTTESTQAGSFEIPKPGDFASAGLWMYFDKGSSTDLQGYPVPQQCLPGVNYTHAGGTSSFDIDPSGDITGSCYLTYYNGTQRLTGSMTGTWDGQADQITFHLETTTEYDAESNGKTGMLVNKTTYDGIAYFNSEIQASGTATWHTECTTTDPEVVICHPSYKTGLVANGTVPFVINFNSK
jgi:hypothetical protein